jgi:prepilin-type N-terminal cleavage/methylation domain-containing protein
MKHRKAFTLVEILVVVGILTLLASILFSAFQHMRVAARRTKCLSNHKQLAMSVVNFHAQNDGYLPGTNRGSLHGYHYNEQPMNANEPEKQVSGRFYYQLSPFLRSHGWDVLKDPADVGDNPNDGYTKFKERGSSYWYVSRDDYVNEGSPGLAKLGISQVVGDYVRWFEKDLGPQPGVGWEEFRAGWPDSGDEGAQSFSSFSSQRNALANSQWANKEGGFWYENLQGDWTANLRWQRSRLTSDPGGLPPGESFVYNAHYYSYNGGSNWSQSSSCHEAPLNWDHDWHTNYVFRNRVQHYDYWVNKSKKVVFVDRDAIMLNKTSAEGTTFPVLNDNTGFWHGYTRRTDGDLPDDSPYSYTNPDKELIRIHASFLDGHADRIDLGKYVQPHRDHDYY